MNTEVPMTATELEERYRIVGGEIQAEMCKLIAPIINKVLDKIDEHNKLSNMANST